MNDRFASDLVFIIVVLVIAALLGFIIGYLYRRIRKEKFIALESENLQLKARLENCLQQKEKAVLFDAPAAKSIFGRNIVENDLTIIEGIGEKIEQLLQKRGITTWHQLSQTTAETIKEILVTDGGNAYQIHDPKTWPAQALLAYEGKWTELKEYQDKLVAGR
jgi:predicted flap endonuclease-1-like 5' DNA nuclease